MKSLSNLEEAKQKLSLMLFEALKMVCRDEKSGNISHACSKETETLQGCGRDEKTGVFLEDYLAHSMCSGVQDSLLSPIGGFDFSIKLVNTFPRSPLHAAAKEYNGQAFSPLEPEWQARSPFPWF